MKHLFVLPLVLAVIIVGINQPCHASAITFSDNFNDGNADGWVFPYNHAFTQAPTTWSVESGTLIQLNSTDHHAALVNNLSFSSQKVETQMTISGYAGITLWYQQVNTEYANYLAVFYL